MAEEKLNEQEQEQEQEQMQEQEQEQEQDNVISDEDIIGALDNPTEAVQKKLNELIQIAVKKALASTTPKKSTVKVEPITKEQFAKMNYEQREKLFNENRSLYNKLSKN